MTTAHHRTGRIRFALLAVMIGVLIVTMLWLGPPDVSALREFVAGSGPAGPVVAVLGVALGIVVMVPRTVMSIATGVLFGWMPAFGYIMFGCLLGASCGFLLGRLLGRDFVADRLTRWAKLRPDKSAGVISWALGWFERSLSMADGWLARHGVVGIWIARIIPLSHYGLLSYVCGTASVRYRPFAGGTLIGSVPGALGYTAVGGAVLGPGGLPLALGLALLMNLISLTTLVLVRRWQRSRTAGTPPTPSP